MGRPRTFEMDQVLDIATSMFQRHGFTGCSLSDLERATGLSRTSLYNAIGDKEDIFRSILARFVSAKHQYVREQLADRSIDGLIGILERVRAGEGPLADTAGCMMATAALECDRMTPAILDDLMTFRQNEIDLFREVFEAERRRGALAPGVDPDGAAVLLATTFTGAAVTARLLEDLKPLRSAVTQLIAVLSSWKVDPPESCCPIGRRLGISRR